MPNLDVRFKARSLSVPLWKVAKAMGIGTNTLYTRLRKELSAEEKQKFFDVIQRVAIEQAQSGLDFARGTGEE